MSTTGGTRRLVSLLAGLGGLALTFMPVEGKKSPDPDPFRAPAESLTQQYRVVALSSVTTPELEGSAAAAATLLRLVDSRLTTAGFRTLPPESVQAVWTEVERRVGGIFDPRTGRRDAKRFQQVREAAGRSLRDRYHVDVWLRPAIQIVQAEFKSGEAEWDGVTRKVGGTGVLNVLVTGVPDGRMPALSFAVEIEDWSGRLLYARRTGIQALARMTTMSSKEVPAEERFGDESMQTYAVDRNLKLWIERVKAAADSL